MVTLSRFIAFVLGLPGRIKLYGFIALVSFTVAAGAIAYFTNQGYQDALQDIEEQDDVAVDAADEAAAAVIECLDTGGVYDQSTGICRR